MSGYMNNTVSLVNNNYTKEHTIYLLYLWIAKHEIRIALVSRPNRTIFQISVAYILIYRFYFFSGTTGEHIDIYI